MSYNLGTAQGNIRIEYDSRGVARARDDLGRFVSLSSLMGDQVDRDTNRASRSFTMFGATVVKATAAILAAGAAANALSSIIAGLVLVTQSIIPVITASLATLPGIILAAVVAFASLKLAMVGVSDALKAGLEQDIGKFNEAIKKLAPNAQQAAKAFYGLVAAFKPVQQGLQDRAFANTAPLISAISAQLVYLQHQFFTAGGAINGVILELLKFAGSPAFIDAVAKSFEGLRAFIEAITPGLQPLLQGFSLLAVQAGKFFASFGDSAGQALATFGKFLGSLDLTAMWETAGTVLRNLGTLFSDLGSIVGSIAGAFTGAGQAVEDFAGPTQTLSNSLGVVVGKLAEFLSSAQGTAILDALAQAMSAVATVGGDVLMSLLQALTPVLVALSPAVQDLARGLGPILGAAFAALSPGLTAVATALSTNLGPVIPRLVESFTRLAPVIGQVAEIFGGVLGGAIAFLLPIIVRIVDVLSGVLLSVLQQLLPYIEQWGEAWLEVASDVLPQLLPLIEQLGPVLQALVPFIVLGAQMLLTLLIPAMRLVVPVVTAIATSMAGLIGIWAAVASAVGALGSTISSVWSAISGTTASTWTTVRTSVTSAVQGARNAVTSAIAGIKATISTLASIPGQVGGYFRSMASAAQGGISALLGAVRAIPGQIRGALGNIGGLLVDAGRQVMQGLINGIRSMAGAVVSAARAAVAGIPGAVKGLLGISSPSKVTMALGREVSTGLAVGIEQAARKVERAMETVAALIPAQLATTFDANAAANGQAYVPASFGSTPAIVSQAAPAVGNGITVNQTVNALPGQSAKAVGNSAVERLVFGVITGTSGLGPAAPEPGAA